jgi:hypothetical protein
MKPLRASLSVVVLYICELCACIRSPHLTKPTLGNIFSDLRYFLDKKILRQQSGQKGRQLQQSHLIEDICGLKIGFLSQHVSTRGWPVPG